LFAVVWPKFQRPDSGLLVVALVSSDLAAVFFGKGMLSKGMGRGKTDFSPQRLERRRDFFRMDFSVGE